MTDSPQHIDFTKQPAPTDDDFLELPEDEQVHLETCLLYVEEATAIPPGEVIISRMKCPLFLSEYYECSGEVELKQSKESGDIEWRCKKCDDNGLISGYSGNHWDLNGIPHEYAAQYLFDKYDQVTEKVEILEGLPFDFEDEEQNKELFDWLDSLEDDQKQDMANLLEERIFLADQELARKHAEANGGLTPEQEYRLFVQDWNSSNGPLFLNDALMPGDDMPMIIDDVKAFMQVLEEKGEFKLTPKDFLKSDDVNLILSSGIWPKELTDSYRTGKKKVKETDFWYLHILRLLIQYSGMMEKDGNRLIPAEKNKYLFEYENIGELHRRLFKTTFKDLDLSYVAGLEEQPFISASFPYTLFRLQQLAEDWISPEDVMRKAIPLTTRLELLRSLEINPQKPEEKILQMILLPLGFFGLLESNEMEIGFSDVQFKKTPLFDRFIQFKF